jgi:hypothetical protein
VVLGPAPAGDLEEAGEDPDLAAPVLGRVDPVLVLGHHTHPMVLNTRTRAMAATAKITNADIGSIGCLPFSMSVTSSISVTVSISVGVRLGFGGSIPPQADAQV